MLTYCIAIVVSGLLAFDHVFLPYMLTDNGQTVAERIGKDSLLIEDGAGVGRSVQVRSPVPLSLSATAVAHVSYDNGKRDEESHVVHDGAGPRRGCGCVSGSRWATGPRAPRAMVRTGRTRTGRANLALMDSAGRAPGATILPTLGGRSLT